MATFTWTGQSTTTPTGDKTIGATDKPSFYGASFNDPIQVGDYQDSTHIEDNANAEQCAGGPHMNNTKFVDSTHVSINGGGSVALSGSVPTNAQCPLKVNFSHGSAVAISDTTLWADDGATPTNAPSGVTFECAEKSNTSWTNAAGSGSALAVANQTSGTSHDYYFLLSVSPSSVGVKTSFRIQMQLTYQ